jgi:hypothetical protein
MPALMGAHDEMRCYFGRQRSGAAAQRGIFRTEAKGVEVEKGASQVVRENEMRGGLGDHAGESSEQRRVFRSGGCSRAFEDATEESVSVNMNLSTESSEGLRDIAVPASIAAESAGRLPMDDGSEFSAMYSVCTGMRSGLVRNQSVCAFSERRAGRTAAPHLGELAQRAIDDSVPLRGTTSRRQMPQKGEAEVLTSGTHRQPAGSTGLDRDDIVAHCEPCWFPTR